MKNFVFEFMNSARIKKKSMPYIIKQLQYFLLIYFYFKDEEELPLKQPMTNF